MHRDAATLADGLDHIRASPRDHGRVELIVRRPGPGEREIVRCGELCSREGLVGDGWSRRPSRRTPDGSPHPDMQLNIVNARVSALLAVDDDHRALAGDQLHLDLDLSVDNLPPGTRLHVGAAIVEVTDQPHHGCPKFTARFGAEALRFVNDRATSDLRLRGINARVVHSGTVTTGDTVFIERKGSAAPFEP